eukprot:TRINITY_DN3741_c0_g1_i1.p2 TRINITY_DN3741_c0_g1~~TRINITY_DN3741_c0_g1_i1.p2  ORF type:complete len:196 (-),score=11.04 TRINITY_DN3741_c0_g1_i1:932-1519(-)
MHYNCVRMRVQLHENEKIVVGSSKYCIHMHYGCICTYVQLQENTHKNMLFMYQSTADSLAIERVKRGQMNEQIQMQWRHIAKTRQEIHELRDKLRSVERSRQLPPGFVPSSTNFHLVPDTVPDIDTPMLNHPVLKQSTSETGYSDSRDSDNTSINGHNVNNNNTASNQLQQLQQQQQSAQMSVYATPFVPTVKQM